MKSKTKKTKSFFRIRNSLRISKKGLEFQYIIGIIIVLLLFIFMVIWYAGLKNSGDSLLNLFFK